MATQTCTGCKRELDESAFQWKDKTRRQSQCRTCRSQAAKDKLAARGPKIEVKSEPLTYTPTGQHSFFRDAIRYREGMDSRERIDRHMVEMGERAVTTAGGAAGLIPPKFLLDEYVLVSRSSRPFADVIPSMPLDKSGVTFTIPAFSTGETVDSQDPENSTPSETDMVTTTISSDLVEIAGQQDVSRQAFERTALGGTDSVIFADLMDAYAERLDAQLLNGSGANNQHLGLRNVSSVNTVTYTSGTPTAAGVVNAILQAASKIGSTRKKWPTVCVMHPTRYAFLMADSGTAALMQHEDEDLAQINYVLDPNVGTTYGAGSNEDEIYIAYAPDFRLAEDVGPLFRFEDVALSNSVGNGTLTVRAQFYAYSLSFLQRNPNAIAIVSGSGLTAPSGF